MSIVHVCVFCVCLSFARSLLAFKRVTLDAGASETVEIPLTRDEMEFYDDDMVLRVVPGDYTLSVGGSSYSAAQVRNVLCSFQLSFFGEAIVYPEQTGSGPANRRKVVLRTERLFRTATGERHPLLKLNDV